MRKTILVMFCLLGILLLSGCKEQPGEELPIATESEEQSMVEEEPIEEPIGEANETIEINKTIEEINSTIEEEIIYSEGEISLCKTSSLGDFNGTEINIEHYDYLTNLVMLEQTTKKPLIRNINRDIYSEETLEIFDSYLTCLSYKIK